MTSLMVIGHRGAPARYRASLTLLIVLVLSAGCTATIDGAAAPSPISEPELVTFDPPLAFDASASTALTLGPVISSGSRLGRDTRLLPDGLVTAGVDGLTRYRATDGTAAWSLERTSEFDPDAGTAIEVSEDGDIDADQRSQPTSSDDPLVGVVFGHADETGVPGYEVVVADLATGAEVWRVEVQVPEASEGVLPRVVDVTEQRVVIGLGYAEGMAAIGPAGLLWHNAGLYPWDVQGDVLHADRVDPRTFVPNPATLDANTGALLWEEPSSQYAVLLRADLGIVSLPSGPAWFDPATGAISGPVEGLPSPTVVCPVYDVAVCYSDGVVLRFDLDTRAIVWTAESGSADPTIADVAAGGVYLNTFDFDTGRELAGSVLDLRDGSALAESPLPMLDVAPWGATCDAAPSVSANELLPVLCPALAPGESVANSIEEPSAPEDLEAIGPGELPMPDAARQRSVDGATEFASYYWNLLDFGFSTGESATLDELTRNCEVCDRQIAGVEGAAEDGTLTARAEVTLAAEPFEVYGTRALILSTVTFGPSSQVDADGNPIPGTEDPGGVIEPELLLTWDPERWTWFIDGNYELPGS